MVLALLVTFITGSGRNWESIVAIICSSISFLGKLPVLYHVDVSDSFFLLEIFAA